MKKLSFIGTPLLASFMLAVPVGAQALNVMCSNDKDWCDLMVSNFEAATGIDVFVQHKSTGEALAQLQAEAGHPSFDVWWGGTGDPHLIAASEGLTRPAGVDTAALLGWASNLSVISGGRVIGIHLGVLGIAYNSERLAAKGIEPPACWRDLINPVYAGEIQVANPNTSGTAYTELATLVQIFGEDNAFVLLHDIGSNVNTYTKSGSAPSKAAARGETGISIGFEHDMVKQQRAGFPLEIVSPCEGTGYEVGGVSIVAGTENLDQAREWVRFVLSPEAQSAAPLAGVYNVPSNSNATLPAEAPAVESIKLIDYDFTTYGSFDIRARLLARWDAEVNPH